MRVAGVALRAVPVEHDVRHLVRVRACVRVRVRVQGSGFRVRVPGKGLG